MNKSLASQARSAVAFRIAFPQAIMCSDMQKLSSASHSPIPHAEFDRCPAILSRFFPP